MPAESSTTAPTRSPAACMASGVSVVNALSDVLDLTIHRAGKVYTQQYRLGDPVAPLAETGVASRTRHHHPLQAVADHLQQHRLRVRNPGQAPARAVVPEFRCAHRAGRRARGQARCVPARRGLKAFVAYLNRARTRDSSFSVSFHGTRRLDRHRSGPAVERFLPGDHALLHQQHPAAGWWHAPGRLPRGAHAHAERLHREGSQEGKDRHHR